MYNLKYEGLDRALKDEKLVLRAIKSRKGVFTCLKERGYGDHDVLNASDESTLRIALMALGEDFTGKKEIYDRDSLMGFEDFVERWVSYNKVLRAHSSHDAVLIEASSFYGVKEINAIGKNFCEAYDNLNRKLRGCPIVVRNQEGFNPEFNLLNSMRKIAWSS